MMIGAIALVAALFGGIFCAVNGAFADFSWLWMLPVSILAAMLVQMLGVFLYLMYLCARVDQNVPQEEDDPHYRRFIDLLLESVLPILQIHIKTTGMEKVPQNGRFMLISNHVNNSDPIVLLRAFRKYQLAFISKRENKDMFVIGPMMHKIQCQLINRENDREALKTILKCIDILKEDKASVAVFPEGRIDDDLKFHHFRPGVFKIAQRAQVPIVVCTLKNTKMVVHNLLRLIPSYVEIKVLDVIPAEELRGVTTKEISDRCYAMMAADLGPGEVAEE